MEPNWKPIEARLGKARCAGFMFMGRVNGINLYKHGISRTYLNLTIPEAVSFQAIAGAKCPQISKRNLRN